MEPLLKKNEKTNESTIIGYEISKDLDSFLINIYYYYRHQGFQNIVISHVTNVLTIFFTLFISCLLFFINQDAIKNCKLDDFSCDESLFIFNFENTKYINKIMFICYIIIFALYITWSSISAVINIREMYKIKQFYENQIDVNDEELFMISWIEILKKLESIQKNFQFIYKRQIYQYHDSLDMVKRIQRKNNFMVWIIENNVLDLPTNNIFLTNLYFNKILEWNIRLAIVNELNSKIERNCIIYHHKRLQKTLLYLGILNLIIAPFTFVYIFIYFFLNNAAHFHAEPKEFMSYSWSWYAQWKFREYNEVHHIFMQRISISLSHAIKFCNQFHNSETSTIARFFTFTLSSIVSILIILGFFNEAILSITIFERNLWWYIAIITGIIAISKSFIHDNIFKSNPNQYLEKIIEFTHYNPDKWKQLNIISINKEISSLLKYKTTILFQELFGVIISPFLLMFYLRKRTKIICNHFKDEMYKDTKVGYICKSSIFPEEQNENNDSKIHKSLCNFNDNYINI